MLNIMFASFFIIILKWIKTWEYKLWPVYAFQSSNEREREEQEIYGNVRQTKTDRKAIIGNAM